MIERVNSPDGNVTGFRRSGSGPALLLVHGTTADRRRWSTINPLFEPHFTVMAMDIAPELFVMKFWTLYWGNGAGPLDTSPRPC